MDLGVGVTGPWGGCDWTLGWVGMDLGVGGNGPWGGWE